jgi:hypothetical protein
VQFERQMASCCELLSLSLDRTMLLAFVCWRLVQFDFCFSLNVYSPKTKLETQALHLWERD